MSFDRYLIKFARDTSGVAMVYALLVFMVLLIIVGFAIDSSNVIYIRARLQNAADASALAGAALIPENTGSVSASDKAAIVAEAQLFAQKNMTAEEHGDVLVTVDVELGFWDSSGELGASRTFYLEGSLPATAIINAVSTTTRKSSDNGNAQDMMLIGMVGADTLNISVSAIAIAPPPSEGQDCLNAGFLALGTAEGGSTNEIRGGWCLHGEEGVKFSSQNGIEGGPGAESQPTISMSSPDSDYGDGGYDFGSDNEVVPEEDIGDGNWANNNLPNIVEQATIADYLNPATPFIFDLSKPAGHSAHVDAAQDMVDTLYDDFLAQLPVGFSITYSSDDVSIDHNFQNEVVVSRKKITIGSDVTMNNVILLAKENVEMGSNVTIGSSSYCDSPDDSMNFILGAEMAKFGSDVEMYNLQVFAGDYVDWGSNNATVGAVSVFSAGSLKFGSDWDIRGCGGANLLLNYSNTSVSEPLRLVQ